MPIHRSIALAMLALACLTPSATAQTRRAVAHSTGDVVAYFSDGDDRVAGDGLPVGPTPIRITGLGFFDHKQDGLVQSHPVAIDRESDQTLDGIGLVEAARSRRCATNPLGGEDPVRPGRERDLRDRDRRRGQRRPLTLGSGRVRNRRRDGGSRGGPGDHLERHRWLALHLSLRDWRRLPPRRDPPEASFDVSASVGRTQGRAA